MNGMLKNVPNHNIFSYSLDFLNPLDLSNVLFVQASRQPQFDETVNFLKNRLNLKKVSLLVSKTYKQNSSTAPGRETLDYRHDRLSGSNPELIHAVTSKNFSSIFITVNEPRWTWDTGHFEALTKHDNVLYFADALNHKGIRTIDRNGFVNTIEDYFLLREFGLNGETLRIYIQMDDREIQPFFKWAMECNSKGNIVEIGRFGGGSTCILALAARLKGWGPVYSIDTTSIDFAKYMISKNKLESIVHLLDGTSAEIASKWPKIVEDPSIGFLLIDGDHSREGVISDMDHWIPFVKKGGFVVFHDVHSMRFPEISKPIYDRIVSNPQFGDFQQVESHLGALFLAHKIS